MAKKNPIERKVYFFQLQRRFGNIITNGIPSVPALDWHELLSAYQELPGEKHWFASKRILMLALEGKKYPILTIGERLSTQFVQKIDNQNDQMLDLADDDIQAGKTDLAQMSAIVFYPKHDAIGYITGAGRPKEKLVEEFLNATLNQNGENFEWRVVPVYTADGLREFKEKMGGVHQVHAKFVTQRNLFNLERNGGQLLSMTQPLANDLQTDVSIDVTIKIPPTSSKDARRKLKEVVTEIAPVVSEQRQTLFVKGTTIDEVAIDYNLLRHPLIMKADIPECDEPRQFSQLVDTLVDVCSKNEDEVYKLIER
ncbi:hypothetical protein BACT_0529 [Bifidobacterium actinocoloniiforme DSM 22766]|uniref:Uncharacterized protein n=1 Tax=Bifidobacterium actinocoloniiforme DSM 22766 TaxID=1437605 RepID=A0A086YZX8_9BIFI|nr:hypothetical protein [Bifidobacterium actinocoloniiforme]AKV55106.1 hypothetical protein AB656_01245 [Bifidobacterium actinocoloniiforme DSM 22766]KFI39828.1 hypothetical protein BACT_0529 [Bifidobacterium actinocoloniiforme DSM 22766]